jgi:gelsolin
VTFNCSNEIQIDDKATVAMTALLQRSNLEIPALSLGAFTLFSLLYRGSDRSLFSFASSRNTTVGSDIDHKVKAAAAEGEAAWSGIGQEEGIKVWRIEQFQVKEWPQDQYGQFFRGDSYIVLKTYKEGDALKHDIHIWIGSESSQDEYGAAAYKMVEADEYLGGAPVQHRQVEGMESSEFAHYFETLEYLDGGAESGFRKVEATPEKPLFFRVKGTTAKTLKMMQVPMAKSSMNECDSFILYAGDDKVWCWHGEKVSTIFYWFR